MTLSVSPDAVLDSNIEAEAEAAEARERGTELIREHLRGHLAQNPRSSYVTWIATLHPENASVEIDPRFLTPGNPWMAIYEETKFYNGGSVDGVIHEQQTRTYSGFLDLTVGMAIALAGALSAFVIEVFALIIHYLADLFEGLTSLSSNYTWMKYSFGLLWLLLWHVMRLVEYILLFVSVMVIEILAAVSFLLCALLGMSLEVGLAAHQRTRRLSHFTRWACRRPFYNVHPNSQDTSMMPETSEAIDPETIAVPTATVVAISDEVPSAKVIAIVDCESGKG
jgi:hypothetical protein